MYAVVVICADEEDERRAKHRYYPISKIGTLPLLPTCRQSGVGGTVKQSAVQEGTFHESNSGQSPATGEGADDIQHNW
jgi:hypothetical protein